MSNKYINETIYLAFKTTEEIDALIEQLDEGRILKVLQEEESKEDLFK